MGNSKSNKDSRHRENTKRREELRTRSRIMDRRKRGLGKDEEEALLAGPVRRYIAYTIDTLTHIFFWGVCVIALTGLSQSSKYIDVAFPVSIFVFGSVYSIPKLKIEGRTFGREKAKIEVIRRDGNGLLTWPRAIIRWWVEIGIAFVVIPILALVNKEIQYVIGLYGIAILIVIAIPIFFTEHRQGLHDIAGDSVVVRFFPPKRKFFKK